jgi:dedicator of cytokinesis protein 3
VATLPVTFPESYPFSLVAVLPKASVSGPTTSQTNETLFFPGLGETAIVLLVLILSSSKKDIHNFLESSLEIEGKDKFIALLSLFFQSSTSILENNAFPKSWLNVNILAHKVLIKIMDPIATILERDFIPETDLENQFDQNLWKEGFYMLLKLLSSDQLVIEEFSPQVRSICGLCCS